MSNNIEFFNQVQTITMYEPLGEFLGSSAIQEFRYSDVVKLSGHSCPTVAGAYLMTLYGLKALYSEDEPIVRGNIKVEIKGSKGDGVIGVIANVASFITGAKENDGFKGLGGIYARNNLLKFDASIKGEIRFTRVDTKASVEVSYNLANLALSGFDQRLMQKSLLNQASDDEVALFRKQWQQRVKEILIDFCDKAVSVEY